MEKKQRFRKAEGYEETVVRWKCPYKSCGADNESIYLMTAKNGKGVDECCECGRTLEIIIN